MSIKIIYCSELCHGGPFKDHDVLVALAGFDTDAAVLVETAFIDNDEDAEILTNYWDDIARAIARGVTDYICMQQ